MEAGIISVSSFIVKLIGVLFKIPLANMLGESMGIFSAAFSLYTMLYMAATSGLAVAVSRMVSVSEQRGREQEVRRTLRVSLILFTLIGVTVTVFMLLAVGPFYRATAHSDSVLAARVLSPALLFSCICTAYRGYYQGLHNMYPTAIGQLIEAVMKISLGLGLTALAQSLGCSASVQAACAVSGMTVGMFLETVMLVIYNRYTRSRRGVGSDRRSASPERLAKRLIRIALPATIVASMLYLANFMDTVLIKKCLMFGGIAEGIAEELYAAYTSYPTAISELFPSTLIYPIAISVLPAVSAAAAVGDRRKTNRNVMQSVRISIIIGLPCAAFLVATAPACLNLLYSGALQQYTHIDALAVSSSSLRILALSIVFMGIVSTTGALLQAIGKIRKQMISVAIGVCGMILVEALGVSGFLGIYGAPIATLCCYMIVSCINLFFLSKYTSAPLYPGRLFVRPLCCAALTAAVTFGVYRLSSLVLSGNGRLQALILLCICGVAAVASYVSSMLLFCGITADEVRLLPKGNQIASFLIRKGWLHDVR